MKLAMLVVLACACGGTAAGPLPKGPPPEYEEEPSVQVDAGAAGPIAQDAAPVTK